MAWFLRGCMEKRNESCTMCATRSIGILHVWGQLIFFKTWSNAVKSDVLWDLHGRTCLPTDWMMLYRLLSTPTMTTTVPLAPPKVDLISTARSEESGTTKSGEQWWTDWPWAAQVPSGGSSGGKKSFWAALACSTSLAVSMDGSEKCLTALVRNEHPEICSSSPRPHSVSKTEILGFRVQRAGNFHFFLQSRCENVMTVCKEWTLPYKTCLRIQWNCYF